MSSQTSIARDVDIGRNGLCADAPFAPDPKSTALPNAKPVYGATRRPLATANGTRRAFAIVAHESTQPAEMAIGRMLTTKEAASLLGRPHSTLERWRCEGRGPDYVKEEGGVRYHEDHLREYIRRNTRTSSVRALVEIKRESL
jgi:hypothetical protein